MPVAHRTQFGVLWLARVQLADELVQIRRSDETTWRTAFTFTPAGAVDLDISEESDGSLLIVLLNGDTLTLTRSRDGGTTWA